MLGPLVELSFHSVWTIGMICSGAFFSTRICSMSEEVFLTVVGVRFVAPAIRSWLVFSPVFREARYNAAAATEIGLLPESYGLDPACDSMDSASLCVLGLILALRAT